MIWECSCGTSVGTCDKLGRFRVTKIPKPSVLDSRMLAGISQTLSPKPSALNFKPRSLESDVKTLAWEAGRRWGVRVNAISAGPLKSRAATAIGQVSVFQVQGFRFRVQGLGLLSFGRCLPTFFPLLLHSVYRPWCSFRIPTENFNHRYPGLSFIDYAIQYITAPGH
jgi:hypothetical protein